MSNAWRMADASSVRVNQPTHYRLVACLVYHFNEGLSIISREIFEFLDLIVIREYGRYQVDAFVYGKCANDQQFPCGVAALEVTVKPTDVVTRMNEKVTIFGVLVRLPKPLDAGWVPDPNSVVSVPTACA